MILQIPPDAVRLLANPDHKPVREMFIQWVGTSLRDTLTHLLFPVDDLPPGQRAVLEAEARILMGFQDALAGASRVAAVQARPPADAKGNSPGGFV